MSEQQRPDLPTDEAHEDVEGHMPFASRGGDAEPQRAEQDVEGDMPWKRGDTGSAETDEDKDDVEGHRRYFF